MSETEDVSATDPVQWRCLELLGNNLAASLQNIDLPAASRFVCVVTQGKGSTIFLQSGQGQRDRETVGWLVVTLQSVFCTFSVCYCKADLHSLVQQLEAHLIKPDF